MHKDNHLNQQTDKVTFGFWVYLMTDCVLFASLFATYAVLHTSTFGGPPSFVLFNLPSVLLETLVLLTSSFTSGLALLAAQRHETDKTLDFLGVTFVLGALFLGLELSEFSHLIQSGNSWQASGFLSAFFTLVGTHGLHITVGLIWILVLLVRVYRRGISTATTRKLMIFSLFWHFLDIVWIFIFTFVYLMGML